MSKILLLVLGLTAAIAVVLGNALTPSTTSSRCGDWVAYKDEKCFKIASRAGYQTQADAEIVCRAYSAELNRESYPRLIQIKTEDEQNFLHNLLYVENNIVDNIWLGLTKNQKTGVFGWSEGSAANYSNWASADQSDTEHNCVQLLSGGGSHSPGKWVKVHCQKKAAVVCEKTQTWTQEALQEIVLRDREELKAVKEEIAKLKQNPVPVGFVYVQLPGQSPPTTLWPSTQWTDIGSSYAGLFFRVEGGLAAPFGQEQADNTRSLLEIYNAFITVSGNPIQVPSDGSLSNFIWTGGDNGKAVGVSFSSSTGEVRPRNKAVKLWQRVV